jgi:phosphoserine phosphatase RsbU/P
MAYLLIPDKKQTRKVPIKKATFFIGRARENDLIIPSDSLSRFHAQISNKEEKYLINDRGSLNGVFLNGSRIYGESALNDGDIIGFGDFHVRFCVEETKPLRDLKQVQQGERFPISALVDSRRFTPEKRERYLELLYHFSSRLLQQFPSSDLGEIALDLIHEVWKPDRSCLMMREKAGEWQISVQRFGNNPQLSGDTMVISSSVVRELEKNEEALLIMNATQDQRFSASESLVRQNVTSVVCAPLWNNKKIHGFLYADLISSERSFSFSDLEMFSILANLMAIKWENDQLWHQTLLQQQLEQELNLAAEIQRKFFPVIPPALLGYQIAGLTIPSRKVGGDAYFWHERSDGSLVLMIADVMGKGLPSALLMSQIQAIMKIFAEQYSSPAAMVTAINEFIYKFSTQDKFISMVVIMLSPDDGKISFCNAGHNPPFMLRHDGTYELFETGGMPVGVFVDQKYLQGDSVLLAGETLLLYTDGLTEARNTEDEEFGMDKLIETARLYSALDSPQFTEQIVKHIREQWLGTDQEDDWTLLVLKRD